MINDASVVVLGAGIIGLTTAHAIRTRGIEVSVVSAEFSPSITSDLAAAVWHPFFLDDDGRYLAWAKKSLECYRELYLDAGTGVSEIQLTEYFVDPKMVPWWSRAVPHAAALGGNELAPGYGVAFRAMVPLVEPGLYLPYLRRRLEGLNVRFMQTDVKDFSEIAKTGDVVVNCTGLGAATLTDDRSLYPIRGQIVRAQADLAPGAFIDDFVPSRPTYVISRQTDCVVGGSADIRKWSLEPDERLTEDILRRATRLVPDFAPVSLDVHVGLRPGRETVRLEVDRKDGRWIIHNYGHGGSGFTLAWGCAEDAATAVCHLMGHAPVTESSRQKERTCIGKT